MFRDIFEPMACWISKFHSRYFGLLIWLAIEVYPGGVKNGLLAEIEASVPPLWNAFKNELLEFAPNWATLPATVGASAAPAPVGAIAKVFVGGELRISSSMRTP